MNERKNGQEVLEELRDDDLQNLPVIILTSSEAEEDVVKSYDLYANAYLTKPVDPEELIETERASRHYRRRSATFSSAVSSLTSS